MQQSYKIVTQGCRQGTDPQQVAQQVAALFRCQPADVVSLLSSRRSVVKRRLDLRRADRYRRALDECGLLASIEEEVPLAAVAPASRERPSSHLKEAGQSEAGRRVPPAPARMPASVPEPVEEQAQDIGVGQMMRDVGAAETEPAEQRISVEDLMFQMRCDAEDERERSRRVHRRFLAGFSVFCLLMLLWMGGLFG